MVDGDDTLWFVEPLYDAARNAVAALVAAAGLDAAHWEQHERAIDVANVAVYGVNPERFPTSCVQAYEALASETHASTDDAVAREVWTVASTVFETVAPVHPSASRVISTLRARGPVVLLTKGDQVVQSQRISDAALADAFDDVRIVADKNEDTFRTVLADHGYAPELSWSIGNSLRSDINPALRIGMHAVWVDAHVWEYERGEIEPADGHLLIVHDLADVPANTAGIAVGTD